MPVRRPLLIAASCAVVGVLGGCVDLPKVGPLAARPFDTTSPVAGQAQAASNTDAPFPKFSEVPPRPTDVRDLRGWRRSVAATVRTRNGLEAQIAADPQRLTQTESFAAGAQAGTTAPAGDRSQATEATEAFAQRLRERATPPPPPPP